MSKSGSAVVKASKTDSRYQQVAVRESDGEIEYYHAQLGQWCAIPSEWVADIVWDNNTKSED